METKTITTKAVPAASSEEGTIECFFSTLETVDREGDIIARGAIKPGIPLPLCQNHDWNRVVGSGVTAIEGNRAVFKGQFFMDTEAGREAFRVTRNLGKLMEFSWGFIVRDSERVKRGEEWRRLIKEVEPLEVSTTIVGAMGRGLTGTLAMKQAGSEIDQIYAEHQRILGKINGTGIDADALLAEHLAITARRNGVAV